MWGYYVGGLLAMQQYGNDTNNQNQGGDDPGRSWFTNDRGWFKPRILRRLAFGGVLTEKQIFDCLTSDVRSHAQLKNRLTQRYGKRTQIEAAFSAEGF
ncbi:hypothetical protein CDL62_17085 [Alkalitalea saponilacus]|nr:hypothetical protein [Alkalitalea saponilacus]ASB50742.1 hypothetical protein CDL62_17085 [Alkalitalea saponilacus]